MSFEAKSRSFLDWASSRGIFLSPKVTLSDLRESHQGRGLIATQDIEAGETIAEVPEDAVIAVSKNPEFNALADKYSLEQPPVLIAYLMSLSANPEYQNYFAVLPTEFTTPMFWSDEQLKLLKGSFLTTKIGKEDANALYSTLQNTILTEPIFEGVDTSISAFHRMGSIMMAYGFDIGAEDDDIERSFLPVIDMANGCHDANAKLDGLKLVASKPIQKGAQVYNTYGDDLPTSEYVRLYGFAEKGGTPNEIAEVSLEDLLWGIEEIHGTSKETLEHRVEHLRTVFDDDLIDDDFEVSKVPSEELIAATITLSMPPTKNNHEQAMTLTSEGLLTRAARDVLSKVFAKRLDEYPKPADLSSAPTFLTSAENMSAQVCDSEVRCFNEAQKWLETAPLARATKKGRH